MQECCSSRRRGKRVWLPVRNLKGTRIELGDTTRTTKTRYWSQGGAVFRSRRKERGGGGRGCCVCECVESSQSLSAEESVVMSSSSIHELSDLERDAVEEPGTSAGKGGKKSRGKRLLVSI